MEKWKHSKAYLLIFTFGILTGVAVFAFIILPSVKGAAQNIAGTWSTGSYNESYYDYNKQMITADWRDYRTVFTADGKIGHYGYRNCDNGTWKWIGINKIKAEFTECYYAPVGEAWYCNADAPSYTEDTNLETWWNMFPETAFFDETVEQNLLATAPELMDTRKNQCFISLISRRMGYIPSLIKMEICPQTMFPCG